MSHKVVGHMQTNHPDWSRLHHAYGFATDTPEHLTILLEGDEEAVEETFSDHLWAAIIHQGTPWTATAPAALEIIKMLYDPRIDRFTWLRPHLVHFLAHTARIPEFSGYSHENRKELEQMGKPDFMSVLLSGDQNIFGNDDLSNSFYAHSIMGCMDIAPQLWDIMQKGLQDENWSTRTSAAMGAVSLVRQENSKEKYAIIEARLLELASQTKNPDERSAYVLSLADLGSSTTEFLHDDAFPVRFCAALSKNLAHNDIALDVFTEALVEHSDTIEDWFTEAPPQFDYSPHTLAVERLISSKRSFEQYAEAAISMAKLGFKYTVDDDWGVFLADAFKSHKGKITTDSQYNFLRILVENDSLWDPVYQNPVSWFEKAGLIYDQNTCRKLLDDYQSS